jgi:acetolactate synthase-1/2/3 large subunit
MRVEKPGDLEATLKEAFALKDRLVFVDVLTDKTENVYPMIAAGKGHNEMHLKPSDGDDQGRELA